MGLKVRRREDEFVEKFDEGASVAVVQSNTLCSCYFVLLMLYSAAVGALDFLVQLLHLCFWNCAMLLFQSASVVVVSAAVLPCCYSCAIVGVAGVSFFYTTGSEFEEICHYHYWRYKNDVRDHLVCNGFVPRMDKLSELGINIETEGTIFDHEEQSIINDWKDDVAELLHGVQDAFREGPNDEAKQFFKLVEEGQEELYPGCKKHSKLSFMIRLFIYKCDVRLPNWCFDLLLEIFKEVLPDASKVPASFNEAKTVLKVLGMDYTKIDACPNDCMLYWEEHANATCCHVCETPRWKSNGKDPNVQQENGKTHKIPRKILRYIPIKKRLQRLFMCEETATYMTWHANGHETVELLLLGNEIYIYLQPLIKDLKDLWEHGLETYDVSSNQRFDMRVAVMTTVSDFPAYAMLSEWSTKGYLAWPLCHYETDGQWLDHSKKGTDIVNLLLDFPNDFGNKGTRKRRDEEDPNPWRKKSILFKLPYWKHCSTRHNLDVMHIEKNVFDNVIGTLLDIPGKIRDHKSARRDLLELKVMPELQPIVYDDGSEEFPRSRFWMSAEQKCKFCQVIKNVKLPQGYASNISRCVQVGERKITSYKSHDAHFMMNYLLPIAVKTTLPKDVATPLIRLSAFFKGIWSKDVDPRHLDKLHSKIVETLCLLEGIFPPAFFDIMVHLPVHLVEPIKLGGPVGNRCMYGIERYLWELKQDVQNKGRPEGSMAEGYQAKECAAFIARYLKKSNNPSHRVDNHSKSKSFFPKVGRPIKGK
ncbi:uncharacterized protein [Spinacia oleracea]|uniref:DUF4218 domain-containing protein n=1 Tax=Spinacia oleracea TaxID=3562 RepID=A0ABM3R7U9_SPIOL|nr:uncharacterized protein LOC130467252 [Spinacia oleracea]